jgi:DNA-nicking Smr family endonuclease
MHRPFAVLEQWIKDGRLRLTDAEDAQTGDSAPDRSRDCSPDPPAELSDAQLFENAMRDVQPVEWSDARVPHRRPVEIRGGSDEQEVLRILERFCRDGTVKPELTDEYVEHSADPVGRLYIPDLRAGRFSVQAHLDLHGFTLAAARNVVDLFIRESVRAGYSCVRIVHGRGRHSIHGRPLMKQNVELWLRQRRLSRHVIAFTSARSVDSGGGAVYVLLRTT